MKQVLTVEEQDFVTNRIMPHFGIHKVLFRFDKSKKSYPDLWVDVSKPVPVISITTEWRKQPFKERMKRIVHEFIHLSGQEHDEKIGYNSIPDKDSYSMIIYEAIVGKENPMKKTIAKVHPEALESLNRYKDDLKSGHTSAAEYWRGQAAAYFTANPEPETIVYIEVLKIGNKWTVKGVDYAGRSRRVSEHNSKSVALKRAQRLADYYHVKINTHEDIFSNPKNYVMKDFAFKTIAVYYDDGKNKVDLKVFDLRDMNKANDYARSLAVKHNAQVYSRIVSMNPYSEQKREEMAEEYFQKLIANAKAKHRDFNPNVIRDLIASRLSPTLFRNYESARKWATNWVAERYNPWLPLYEQKNPLYSRIVEMDNPITTEEQDNLFKMGEHLYKKGDKQAALAVSGVAGSLRTFGEYKNPRTKSKVKKIFKVTVLGKKPGIGKKRYDDIFYIKGTTKSSIVPEIREWMMDYYGKYRTIKSISEITHADIAKDPIFFSKSIKRKYGYKDVYSNPEVMQRGLIKLPFRFYYRTDRNKFNKLLDSVRISHIDVMFWPDGEYGVLVPKADYKKAIDMGKDFAYACVNPKKNPLLGNVVTGLGLGLGFEVIDFASRKLGLKK